MVEPAERVALEFAQLLLEVGAPLSAFGQWPRSVAAALEAAAAAGPRR